MAKKYRSPDWAKECRKAMIDKDMDMNDLAKELGCYTREHLSQVLSGRRPPSDECKATICNHLGVAC